MPYVVSASLPPWLVAGVIAFLPSARCVCKLRSDYLAIATIGIAEIFRLIVLNNETWATNGPRGISRDPAAVRGTCPSRWNQFAFLGVVLVIAGSSFTVLMEIARKSPWGRVMTAIRDNETSAKAAGKNVETFPHGRLCHRLHDNGAGRCPDGALSEVRQPEHDHGPAAGHLHCLRDAGRSAAAPTTRAPSSARSWCGRCGRRSEIVAPRLLEAIGMTDARYPVRPMCASS